MFFQLFFVFSCEVNLYCTPIFSIEGNEFKDFLVIFHAPGSFTSVEESSVTVIAHFGVSVWKEIWNLIPINFGVFSKPKEFFVFFFGPPLFFGLVAKFQEIWLGDG